MTSAIDSALAYLSNRSNIAFIRVQWVDLTNTVRFRVLPRPYFSKLLEKAKSTGDDKAASISLSVVTLGIVGLSVVDGFCCVGELPYVFDLASLKSCGDEFGNGYAPRHASVLGWFREKTPSISKPFEVTLCPRSLLASIEEDAKNTSKVEFLVGFESEFILLKPGLNGEHTPVNDHPWSAGAAFRTGSAESRVLEEIVDALSVAGIEVLQYHSEGAPGQYEVVTGPLPPLRAADALVYTRETIYNVANKHGLRATFAPRLFKDSAGSGAHCHFSVHDVKEVPIEANPQNKITKDAIVSFGDPPNPVEITLNEASFLSNLLDNLSSLSLLTMPTSASYSRMQDGIWSGGTYVCWGFEHRETPIRLCNPRSQAPSSDIHKSRNFELKMLDGTANPYVALSGLLGLGLQGIQLKKPLARKPIQGRQSAADMTPFERGAYGRGTSRSHPNGQAIQATEQPERLPLTLAEAQANFESNEPLKDALGADFVRGYLAVNKALNATLQRRVSNDGGVVHHFEDDDDLLLQMF
ncbi:glutamine synthetase/guanido kinase [Coprinopsis marcescibilis]|uniref:Glutamine synthetase/guanido kinase n=1 Tax=Coprinopsis marcescibilis TaxID=230819 RepID=A0A5C3KVF0_COPMA|nr:glutamine synthetase/guanido kinase [Coprinopsis marcescibilis]